MKHVRMFSIWNFPGPLKTGKPFQVFTTKSNSDLPWPYNHPILVTIELKNAILVVQTTFWHRRGGIGWEAFLIGSKKVGCCEYFTAYISLPWLTLTTPEALRVQALCCNSPSQQLHQCKDQSVCRTSFLIVPMDEFGPSISKLGLVVTQCWCLIITACRIAFVISYVPLTHVCMVAWPG